MKAALIEHGKGALSTLNHLLYLVGVNVAVGYGLGIGLAMAVKTIL